MKLRKRHAALLLPITLSLAACGGGGTSLNMPAATTVTGANTGAHAAKAAARFEITVPQASSASSSTRHAQYVSTGTASATITLTTVNGATAPAGFPAVTAALTTGSSNCTSASGSRVCTLSVAAPPGADAFTVTLSNSAGAALSTNSETVTIVAGQTTTAPTLVLGGIATTYPIQAAITAATTVHVTASGAGFRILGGNSYTFSLSPVDASGATIIGPGTPTVGLTSGSSAVTVTAIGGLTNTYAVKVVAQSALPVTLTAQSTGGAAVSVPITTAPEYFIADSAGSTVRAFDISGTTATPIASDTYALPGNMGMGGIALGATGNVWVSDENNHTVSSYAGGSANPITTISVGDPWQIAFDPTGNLWVENYSITSPYVMYLKEYNPATGALLTTTTTVGASDAGPLAINSAGQLWFGNEYYGNAVSGFTSSGQSVGTPLNVPSSYNPNALAFDASGRLWLGGTTGTIAAYNTTTGALIGGTTITGGCLGSGEIAAIRFDPSSNIIVLKGAGSMCVFSSTGSLLTTIPLPTITSSYVNDMAISP